MVRLLPACVVGRGIGQVMFQENALTGLLFVVGIALSIPLLAAALVAGAVIGTVVAWLARFDKGEVLAGIYGFNPALVGIATLFLFEPGLVSLVLLVVGSIVATFVTRWCRAYVPFPTYTAPFVVTTWGIFFLAPALGAVAVGAGYPALLANPPVGLTITAIAHGIGQVMFQASVWTGLFFAIGIAVNCRPHAVWVVAASFVGMLVANYQDVAGLEILDPEQLVGRRHAENITLGLYGYNATLVALALFLNRRTLVAPILGMILSVPLTEVFPQLGLPALTAPFVLATWIILFLEYLEPRLFIAGR
ncbi:MAG: urea transporter [Bacteroidales bacterium]|nr:urea transporter [Bacteroidales bacterium]